MRESVRVRQEPSRTEAPAPRDQAAGLRRLLRPPVLRILPVLAGCDTAQRASVTVNLAAAAALDGYSVVVLDQSRGEVARSLGLRPRYELMHLLEGDRDFAEVALQGADGVRVLSGARGMAALAGQGGQAEALFSAFARLEQPADLVLVNVDDPLTAAALMPAADGELLLVTSAAGESITSAYAHIKQLAQGSGLTRYRLLVGEAADEGEARSVATRMATVARQFLAARLDYGGCVPRDPHWHQARHARATVLRHAPQSSASLAFRRIAAGIPEWSSFEICGPRPGDSAGRPSAH